MRREQELCIAEVIFHHFSDCLEGDPMGSAAAGGCEMVCNHLVALGEASGHHHLARAQLGL